MGRNKLLMHFRGKSLVEHAVDTLLASEIDEIIVVLGYESEVVRRKLEGRPVRFVENPDYRDGLAASVRAGNKIVSPDADGIMIYLADQPLLEPTEINLLVHAFARAKDAGKSIVVPFFGDRRGNPVIFDQSYREMVLDIAGDIGCRRIIKTHPDQVFAVRMETDHVVRDIDTPEDFGSIT
jgi:molybdenum cofactor cytidylyltransferase